MQFPLKFNLWIINQCTFNKSFWLSQSPILASSGHRLIGLVAFLHAQAWNWPALQTETMIRIPLEEVLSDPSLTRVTALQRIFSNCLPLLLSLAMSYYQESAMHGGRFPSHASVQDFCLCLEWSSLLDLPSGSSSLAFSTWLRFHLGSLLLQTTPLHPGLIWSGCSSLFAASINGHAHLRLPVCTLPLCLHYC